MAQYEGGNALRGYYFGEFADDDTAWNVLSERFNQAYPSRGGRDFELKKIIRHGKTEGGNETLRDRLIRERVELAIQNDK